MSAKKAFQLRISEDIWLAVRRWSDDELRSVNAQIEYLLRDALRRAGRLPGGKKSDRDDPGAGTPESG
ncbi:MAG: Arc family DNA binding domain-containing protein [Lysobacterales bacterium]|jgi:hypothetical protein